MKSVYYQLFVRVFGNKNLEPAINGSYEQNGSGKLADVNAAALNGLKELGVTHVWYTGVIEHATQTAFEGIAADHPSVVKGIAGSPYAIKDYFDIAPALATDPAQRQQEFDALVARTHQAGMQAIIDFVPNHLARQYNSSCLPHHANAFGCNDDTGTLFSPNNNFYYLPGQPFVSPQQPVTGLEPYSEVPARATGNDVFLPNPSLYDWYETIKLNYGVDYRDHSQHFDPEPDTWHRMLEVLLYWLDRGVDGFRCDMVELVPQPFWHWVIAQVRQQYPKAHFIAEIYNTANYEHFLAAGFDLLYDKSGLYDVTDALLRKKRNADAITEVLQENHAFEGRLLKFIENHDEVRVASRHFGNSVWASRPAWALAALSTRCPIMLYFGQEVGETGDGAAGYAGDDGRTSIFDYWTAPQHQRWMNGGAFDGSQLTAQQRQLRDFHVAVNRLARQSPAVGRGQHISLHELNAGRSWDYDERYIYAFLRHSAEETLLVLLSFERTRLLEPRLVLPAFLADGLKDQELLSVQPLLYPGPAREISKEELQQGRGVHLLIEPLDAQVYRLQNKSLING